MMEAKVPKFSEVFHKAADQYLWNGEPTTRSSSTAYSCLAVWDCIDFSYLMTHEDRSTLTARINTWLEELGLNCYRTQAFDEFRHGSERQSVRYAWLKFCALLAEEEGV